MENTSILLNICNFNSIECNEIIRSITYNTKIPKSTESIISVRMYLCQIHYNRFILNEIRNNNYKVTISIKINNLDDNNNLQNELIEAIQNESTEVIQDESIEFIQNKSI